MLSRINSYKKQEEETNKIALKVHTVENRTEKQIYFPRRKGIIKNLELVR